jgi:hypothetical protein
MYRKPLLVQIKCPSKEFTQYAYPVKPALKGEEVICLKMSLFLCPEHNHAFLQLHDIFIFILQ